MEILLTAYIAIVFMENIFCIFTNLYMVSKIITHKQDKIIKYINKICKYSNVMIIIDIFTLLVVVFLTLLPIS